MTNEEKARNIASQWCRCFKCDGIIRDTRNKCNKDGMITCHQWYHSYRAAKLACEAKDQQFKEYLEKKRDEYMSQRDDANMWTEQWAVFHALTCSMHQIINELFKEN